MRALILLLLYVVLLLPAFCLAQNLLNQPESVVFDSVRNRYLVSNFATGHVVTIDSNGDHSYFVTNQQCFLGMQIVGDVLYASCRQYGVKGFDLATGDTVFFAAIPGSPVLNDITADTSGNLYVSYPLGSQIYRINIATRVPTLIASTGLNTPNGLYYDAVYNRVLIVSYRSNSPVQAFDLDDSTLSVVTNTSLDNLDGITMDNDRNVYVSSWATNAVHRFDSTLTNPPETFSTHASDPADIYFNKRDNVLCVPLYYANMVEFIDVVSVVEPEGVGYMPGEFALYPNYPNPFNSATTIRYSLPTACDVHLAIYDVLGRNVATLVEGQKSAGIHVVNWQADNLSSGVYFYRLRAGECYQSNAMILLK